MEDKMMKNKVNYEQAVALCDFVVKNSNGLFEKQEEKMDETKRYYNEKDNIHYPIKLTNVFEYKSPKGNVYRYPSKTLSNSLTLVLCGNLGYVSPGIDLLNVGNSLKRIDEDIQHLENTLSMKRILSSIVEDWDFRKDDTVDVKDFMDSVKKYHNDIEPAFKEMYKVIDNLKLIYKQPRFCEKQEQNNSDEQR